MAMKKPEMERVRDDFVGQVICFVGLQEPTDVTHPGSTVIMESFAHPHLMALSVVMHHRCGRGWQRTAAARCP